VVQQQHRGLEALEEVVQVVQQQMAVMELLTLAAAAAAVERKLLEEPEDLGLLFLNIQILTQ
jgi:hypothetical protein